MKKVLAVLAVAAFAFVLLAKPFDFLQHYSEHAGHAVHAVTTNADSPADRSILVELRAASQETGYHSSMTWLIALGVLGLIAGVCCVRRVEKEERNSHKQGLL